MALSLPCRVGHRLYVCNKGVEDRNPLIVKSVQYLDHGRVQIELTGKENSRVTLHPTRYTEVFKDVKMCVGRDHDHEDSRKIQFQIPPHIKVYRRPVYDKEVKAAGVNEQNHRN